MRLLSPNEVENRSTEAAYDFEAVPKLVAYR